MVKRSNCLSTLHHSSYSTSKHVVAMTWIHQIQFIIEHNFNEPQSIQLVKGTQFFLSSCFLASLSLVPVVQQDMELFHLPFSVLEPAPDL